MITTSQIYYGEQKLTFHSKEIKEDFVELDGDRYYQIENYTEMDPFFMTIISNSNHWMFVSSTGGLTAGRVNSESALFPYYTDDKITENYDNTGSKTILFATKNDKTYLWKPFSGNNTHVYKIKSIISKNVYGSIIRFEEINETLGISFSYSWMTSKKYGLIRKANIWNLNDSIIDIKILDGLQNIVPAGTESKIQNVYGNLLNAYKKNEINEKNSLAIFALSAKLSDLAEPSESLKANTVWQAGLKAEKYLLSSNQVKSFSMGKDIQTELTKNGERGCYFVQSKFYLDIKKKKEWIIVADVNKDHCQINNLGNFLLHSNKEALVTEDVEYGKNELIKILNQNDGIQLTANKMNCVHHQSNVMFNIMRGGYFYNSYKIDTNDFIDYLTTCNKIVSEIFSDKLSKLQNEMSYGELQNLILSQNNNDLERIWYEYLPLTFSRRHGDPSRPWNIFSIQTEKEDGSPKLDYQGNWRDIFQNWEALCYSYPEYIKHTIHKFLNASTKDGYNPYRISRNGIDWEVPEPDYPWANIGYWSDHQIIYLLKLLEMYQKFHPEKLLNELNNRTFTFGNVPYEIKPFSRILDDPYNTIVFNKEKDNLLNKMASEIGSDGKLLYDNNGKIFEVTMTEKLFIQLLAKLANFIPEGGIWMNTQRPEWNDANNALVGKGISVVTLAYLRRYIAFLIKLYSSTSTNVFIFNKDTSTWFNSTFKMFSDYRNNIYCPVSCDERFRIVESLGQNAEKYREPYYRGILKQKQTEISVTKIMDFLKTVIICIDDTLYKNKRPDNLYHSYNTLQIDNNKMVIQNLYEMLEGQVAILSSGLLTPEQADITLNALKLSTIYRKDQNSYMLYPDRILPGFLEKNNIPVEDIKNRELLCLLNKNGNKDLFSEDDNGNFHFNGNFHNVNQVRDVLNILDKQSIYSKLVQKERKGIEQLFETTFNHHSFTGRSGTFYAFEGLGSIYWHMVSKLLLSAQENIFLAVDNKANIKTIESLKQHYYDIRDGIGYNKKAENYGSFPFDPYSHTPSGKGARQPGMTGQVKEEVITRLSEIGLTIKEGQIVFDRILIDPQELISFSSNWTVENCLGEEIILEIPAGSLAGTYCQTPFIIHRSQVSEIKIYFNDNTEEVIKGNMLSKEYSNCIFKRNGNIKYLKVDIPI